MTAVAPGFRLRFLGFFGPQEPPATVAFGAGLNVIYGASNTGKSFIVEAIDFMLGGKPPLRDIPERVGYDLVLLGLETLDGKSFTLWRSMDGGGFRLYEDLHQTPPVTDIPYMQLDEKHSDRNSTNLSSFLLDLCDLGGKRVRKNSRNETISLSFRNIARLMIVDETEITQQSSPLVDGNPTANTPNLATFKLLLTGTDDSALVASNKSEPEELSREAQLHLLDQLLDDYRDQLKELTKSPKELEEQLEKIDTSLRQQAAQVNTTEAEFQEAAGKRRELRKKLEESRERHAEVGAMLERFSLLDRHYVSDIERLHAIEEGGTLFSVLGAAHCPLCGADPAHHRANTGCNGDTDAVVQAARMEIAKIEILRTELVATVQSLEREGANFDRRMPTVVRELESISESVEELIAPKLSILRKSYSEPPRFLRRLQPLREWSYEQDPSNKFFPEVRERAVRLVQEHRGEYPSLWATAESIAPKMGCTAYTLLKWVKRYEVDSGAREGVTIEERERIKALEREVKELRRANEILKSASTFFAQAAQGRELKK